MNIDEIRSVLQDATEEKKRVRMFHTLILLNADTLKNLDPLEFSRAVGFSDPYATEFIKMINISRTLSELGYSIQKQ